MVRGPPHVSPHRRLSRAPPSGVQPVTSIGALALHDRSPDPAFDRLARLAAAMLDTPAALVSIVDADRQVFKGFVGLPEPWASEREVPLAQSFCQHTVASAGRSSSATRAGIRWCASIGRSAPS